MMKINSDDNNKIDLGQKPVEKILPVNGMSATKNSPQYGNELPGKVAKPEPGIAAVDTIDPSMLDQAVKKINENMQLVHREIHFSVDSDSGKTVIKVIDLATDEVIRQIPNEEALSFARNLSDGEKVELFNEYI